jgi:hypothetical protein
MIKRIGVTGAVLVAAVALGAIVAPSAPANPPVGCYKAQNDEFGVTGNYKNATCTEKTAVLKAEYVLAEPLIFLKEDLWCAKMNPVVGPPGTGQYENSTCTKKKEDAEYTEVIASAPALACYKAQNDEFGVSGNYKNKSCTEKTASLKGEYVLAELLLFLKEDLWCAKMTPVVGPPGTGQYKNAACTEKQEDGEYTEVEQPEEPHGEQTKLLPEPTVALPVTAVGSSGEGTLEQVNGATVKCKTDKGESRFTTPNEGTETVLFEGCTGPLTTTCTGVGDTTGTVAQSGPVLYLLALEMITATTTTLVPAFAFKPAQFHFTCTKTGIEELVLVRSCVAARALGIPALPTAATLLSVVTIQFQQFSTGQTKILSILLPSATSETKCLLESSISASSTAEEFTLAALTGVASFSTWKQNAAGITVLLMN